MAKYIDKDKVIEMLQRTKRDTDSSLVYQSAEKMLQEVIQMRTITWEEDDGK